MRFLAVEFAISDHPLFVQTVRMPGKLAGDKCPLTDSASGRLGQELSKNGMIHRFDEVRVEAGPLT
jgi:hypothetical protein